MSGLPWECQKASRKGLMKTIALDLLVPTLTLFGAVRFAMEVDSLLVVVSVPLAFAFWFLACLVINICEIEADARMEDLYDFRKQMDMLPGVETSYQSCFGLVSRPWWPFLDVNRLDVYLRGPIRGLVRSVSSLAIMVYIGIVTTAILGQWLWLGLAVLIYVALSVMRARVWKIVKVV